MRSPVADKSELKLQMHHGHIYLANQIIPRTEDGRLSRSPCAYGAVCIEKGFKSFPCFHLLPTLHVLGPASPTLLGLRGIGRTSLNHKTTRIQHPSTSLHT